MSEGRLRLVGGRAVREVRRWVGHRDARGWPPYSRLLLLSDSPKWVLAYEMSEIAGVARRLGICVADSRLHAYVRRQSVFYASQFGLLNGRQYRQPNRLATAYFHGKPGTGVAEFDRAFEALRGCHDRLDRVQVSHREMRDIVLSSGIDAAKVHLIPIAVDPRLFSSRTAAQKAAAREALGIPAGAAVVGSFQKDGVGWGDGDEPKLVKGPDVFLAAIDLLRREVPDLFVLLSGPSRGFVRCGLERMNVPYRHEFPADPRAVVPLYHALDVYLVSSRQEGGPKAVLESMATGVPLVTTRVGQATDLVRHGENGWMVDVEDAAGLARWAAHALSAGPALDAVVAEGRRAAEANSYETQLPAWARFFDGFVDRVSA